jgi:hypothetical protein
VCSFVCVCSQFVFVPLLGDLYRTLYGLSTGLVLEAVESVIYIATEIVVVRSDSSFASLSTRY